MALSERMYQVLKYAATSKNGVCPLTGQAGEANQTDKCLDKAKSEF